MLMSLKEFFLDIAVLGGREMIEQPHHRGLDDAGTTIIPFWLIFSPLGLLGSMCHLTPSCASISIRLSASTVVSPLFFAVAPLVQDPHCETASVCEPVAQLPLEATISSNGISS